MRYCYDWKACVSIPAQAPRLRRGGLHGYCLLHFTQYAALRMTWHPGPLERPDSSDVL